MSKINDHREKSLISVPDFAKKKNVSRQAVHYQINETKAIGVVHIGVGKYPFIDWDKHKDFLFIDKRR